MIFPNITHSQQQGHELTLQLSISPELEAFKGHFDNFPIVPGVVQLQWTLHFFKSRLAPELKLTHNWSIDTLSVIKFQHTITPNTLVQLTLAFDEEKHCLGFKIYNEDHRFASGKLFLKTVSTPQA